MDTQIRLQIDLREPLADGMSFGYVGPYERLAGEVSFAVDPDDPAYGEVVDLQRAMGSASELEYHLIPARDLKMLECKESADLEDQVTEIRRILASLIRRLRTTN